MIILLHCLLFSLFCTVSTCINMFGYTWCEPVNSWTSEARPLHTRSILYQVALLDQTFLQGKLFTPKGSCTRNPSQQTPLAPNSFYTWHLEIFYIYTKNPLHLLPIWNISRQTTFYTEFFCTKNPLQQIPYYTKQACKNNPAQPKFSTPFQLISFTPQDFCIHLHQAILTPKNP